MIKSRTDIASPYGVYNFIGKRHLKIRFYCIIYSVYRIKEKKAPKILAAIFIASYIICSVLTYCVPYDLLSAAAAMTCAFAFIQENSSVYRIFILMNGLIWLVYDFILGAYTMMFSHIATVVSATIGIIRFDIKKKK